MTRSPSQTIMISPVSRSPLLRFDDHLSTADRQESFPIESGIINLLQQNSADELRREIEVFDNLPIKGVSYFRSSLYRQMIDKLIASMQHINPGNSVFRFAELGSGEGHCAQHIASTIDSSEVYVCDLSRIALGHAPAPLRQICADITQPLFASGSLDAAAFWVSLHHIPNCQRRQAIQEAYRALKTGGVLILFEPNNSFFIRRIIYCSSLRHDIYFDEQESAVNFGELAAIAGEIGFQEVETLYLNPPYNPAFVRQLKRWWLYTPAVELLHQAGRLLHCRQSGRHNSLSRYSSLYGIGFFRRP